VRVEGRHDLGDAPEVPVDERAEARVVLDRAPARAAGHEELELGQAEGVLHVDGEKAHPDAILGSGTQALGRGERRGIRRPRRLGHTIDGLRGRGVEGPGIEGHHATSGWITSPEGSLGWKNVLLAGIDSPASETSTTCWTGVARSSTASRASP